MGKKLLSLCMALVLCLVLLPVTALAVDTAPQTLYVGSTTIGTGYWTSSDGGKVWTSQADEPEGNNYIYYDGQGTLKLHNVTIQGADNTGSPPYGAGIYALCSQDQPVALTIELIGTNTITGYYGIFLNAEIDASSYGTNATLTITGENNGSLGVSGSDHGIYVKSGTGNASINIKNVAVTSSTNGNSAAGVYVMSSSTATNSPNISLSVDGGSLTASGTGSSDGIWFYVGSSQATGATTSLTVSENAIVDARNGGISASRILVTLPTPTPTGNNSSGIVFDGSAGTVYGDVTLDESLTINQGETLTIPEGSSLNCNDKLTNNGTILASGGTVTGSLSGGTPLTTPSISQQPQSTTVTEGSTAEFSITASDAQTYQWQRKATYTESEWENISDATTTSYTTAATTTNMNGYQYRCVVTGSGGVSVISQTATLTVQAKPASVPVTGVTLDKTSLTLQETGSDTLTATVEPADATNKNVTWQSDNANVATVQNGTVNAVGAGKATITVTTADGGKIATCEVTVTHGNMVHTPKKVATCTAEGNTEYWTCEACGKYFSDAEGKTEIELSSTVIPAAGHRFSGGTCTVCGAPDPNYTPPYIPPSKPNWTSVARKLANAQPGDTVTVKMNGETEVPGDVWETIAGRDVTVVLDMGGDVSWTVDGNDVPTATHFADMDFGVDRNTTGIDVDVINAITGQVSSVQITLAHDGEFGFTLTLTAPLGRENAGSWANLYHYHEDAESLSYETSGEIQEDGTASLKMTHASQYAIIIDDQTHQLSFTDVASGTWYEGAVRYAYLHDIMEGMSETEFAPATALTRAMAVQIFYNLEGQPDISGENLGYPYEDVDAQAWYGDAVYWARITGVATGYGDGTFQPGDSITRQEFAQMLYNYAEYKGYDLTAAGDLSQFPDSGSVADWAETAMSWANGNELINGHDDGTIDAAGTATRAQAASILMRFDQNLVEK